MSLQGQVLADALQILTLEYRFLHLANMFSLCHRGYHLQPCDPPLRIHAPPLPVVHFLFANCPYEKERVAAVGKAGLFLKRAVARLATFPAWLTEASQRAVELSYLSGGKLWAVAFLTAQRRILYEGQTPAARHTNGGFWPTDSPLIFVLRRERFGEVFVHEMLHLLGVGVGFSDLAIKERPLCLAKGSVFRPQEAWVELQANLCLLPSGKQAKKKAMERLRTYVASRCRILLQAWGGQSGLCSLPTGSVHQDSDLFSYFFVRLALLLRLESSQQWDDAELLEPTTGATAWTALALKDLSSPTARVHAVLETEGEQHSWPASLAFTPPLSI